MALRFSRWRRGPGFSTLLLLGFVAAALIGGVTVVWQTVRAERQQREQATRTNAVLMALRDISRTAVNGETGQRGYLITLDRRYLAPYLVAREQYRGNLARLRKLMGPELTPRQRALLGEIETLSTDRFAELGESVTLIRGGDLLEARRRLLTDEGQDMMERLRLAVAELEQLELGAFEAARERAVAAEARILPLLAVLLVVILATLGLGLVQVIRAADAEARAENAEELRRARDQADLLASELNHRVKNLFAVVLAIVKMTGRGQPEARPTVDRIAQRIHALLTAHDVSQGTSARRSAALHELVATALQPYRSEDHACTVEGPPVELPEHAIVPLGLVLHELTTNAVKYGAWAEPGGELTVRWELTGGRLRLDWSERAAAPVPATQGGRGFGSALIDSSSRQLGGTIERTFTTAGIVVRIEIPLSA
ncbi:CHASE3 domain-containing protein [Novosphingobium piscinae]|uniref:histidine kinase n=1 Tax=Novosphingobium piscinae TaxID=1507448 RepID=A0A7X1FZN3_9SPHN|nr:CHASE3 domain-containing protein [Novosphingobium piscinae]MBC2669936.1 CHASE3 domain-containing protein [Novosphingobium piscinae]